ncbi:MAG: cytochrome c assembly protein [Anaerospora sp.]|nr:cytochrome c assembly protein [Anaerospora sp.]
MALRASIEEQEQRAKLAAVYALLSSITVPFLVFIVPRFYFSLHPEPVLNAAGKIEMDNSMLYVLIAALAACTALFARLLTWMVQRKKQEQEQCAAQYKKELRQL